MALKQRSHNFFNLRSFSKLYSQLHNRPDVMFATVGEAMKWRDLLVSQEDDDQMTVWSLNAQRKAWLVEVESGVMEATEYAVWCVQSNIQSSVDALRVRSGKRMADIRAITTFFHRCGLEA